MNTVNKNKIDVNFEDLDAQILAQSDKDMITYKKDTVTHILTEEAFSRLESAAMVNNFVEFLKSNLLEGTALIFTGHGRLIPRLKEGGRPVRDLSRKTSIPMKTTATVTFSKTQKCSGEKMSTPRIVRSFVALYSGTKESAILAKITAEVFIALIHRTTLENRRMEVRGLGVFRSTLVEEREGRNPKTGVPTMVVATNYPRFRISTPFRNQLTEALMKLQ